MPAPSRRVAAIGLDGAAWGAVEDLVSAGALPRLEGLRRQAAFARLHHRGAPPDASFVAGVGRAIYFDLPSRWLGRASDDTIAISGWGAPEPGSVRSSQPPSLLREIDELFEPHPVWGHEIASRHALANETLVYALVSGARRRTEISCWLLDRYPDWRLFVAVLPEWRGASEQLGDADRHEVYAAVDAGLGLLADAIPPDAVVVLFSTDATDRAESPDGFALALGPGIEPRDLGEHDALSVTATVAALAGADVNGFEAPPLPVTRD